MSKQIRQLSVDIITFAWSLDIDRIGDIIAALPDLSDACDRIADSTISSRPKKHKAIRKAHAKRTTVANIDHIERLQGVLSDWVVQAQNQLGDADVLGAMDSARQMISRSLELLTRCAYQLGYNYRGQLPRLRPPSELRAAYIAAWEGQLPAGWTGERPKRRKGRKRRRAATRASRR